MQAGRVERAGALSLRVVATAALPIDLPTAALAASALAASAVSTSATRASVVFSTRSTSAASTAVAAASSLPLLSCRPRPCGPVHVCLLVVDVCARWADAA